MILFQWLRHSIKSLKVFLPKADKTKRYSVMRIFFLIQFNVPFKIILLIETSQSIGGAKREYPGKTT